MNRIKQMNRISCLNCNAGTPYIFSAGIVLSRALLVAFTIFISTFCSHSQAASLNDSENPIVQPFNAGTASAGTASVGTDKSAPLLKSGIKMIVLNLSRLRHIGLDLKHIHRDACSLYDEVSIRPVELIEEPEIVCGVPIEIPISSQPIGPAEPPRKDRLDLTMSELSPLVKLLKNGVDEIISGNAELDLSDSVKSKLHTQFIEWVNIVNTMADQESQLEQLTQGPTYNNQAIADLAVGIASDVKKLDKTRRSIYKEIRREGRHLTANAKSLTQHG